MNAARTPVSSRTASASTVALLGLGIGALMLRLRIIALPDSDRIVVLAIIYGTLLVGSLLVPARGSRARVGHALAVFAVGLAGIAIARLAGGNPAAVPFGPWVLPLATLAAVAEEAFFRRSAFTFVDGLGGPVAAVLITAVGFAAIHVPLYGVAAFPIDLGAGLLFGWQRWETSDWTVPATTHVAANIMAVIAR